MIIKKNYLANQITSSFYTIVMFDIVIVVVF